MIKCPRCRKDINDVKNSRPTIGGSQIWRRRFCGHCGEMFTTYERSVPSFLTVQKRDGAYEPYHRTKLQIAIYMAFSKISGRQEAVDKVVDNIENRLLDLQKKTINTTEIADIALEVLSETNPQAFLRYLAFNKKPDGSIQLARILKKYGQ